MEILQQILIIQFVIFTIWFVIMFLIMPLSKRIVKGFVIYAKVLLISGGIQIMCIILTIILLAIKSS